jgi:hypothetical protein
MKSLVGKKSVDYCVNKFRVPKPCSLTPLAFPAQTEQFSENNQQFPTGPSLAHIQTAEERIASLSQPHA